MVDIATGIFSVQVPGDYELHYQGRDVSVFLFFPFFFHQLSQKMILNIIKMFLSMLSISH